MPIDFPCSVCGQMLRVGDDASGREARCPNCQSVMTVPAGSAAPATPQSTAWNPFADSSFAADTANPYAAPQQAAATSSATWSAGPFSPGPVVNVPVNLGSVVEYAVAVWKEQLGLLVGVMLVIMVLDFVMAYMSDGLTRGLARAGLRDLAAGMTLLSMAARFVVDSFLSVGFWQMTLKMARRQPVEFAELFMGGPRLLPAMAVYLLMAIAVTVGFVLLIVPGLVLLAIWWPCYILVIDGKASVGESFSLARTVTANNIGTSVLLWLLSVGISLLGLMACCVGIVAAAPLASMLFTVAYLMMSGQLPVSPFAPPGQPFAVR